MKVSFLCLQQQRKRIPTNLTGTSLQVRTSHLPEICFSLWIEQNKLSRPIICIADTSTNKNSAVVVAGLLLVFSLAWPRKSWIVIFDQITVSWVKETKCGAVICCQDSISTSSMMPETHIFSWKEIHRMTQLFVFFWWAGYFWLLVQSQYCSTQGNIWMLFLQICQHSWFSTIRTNQEQKPFSHL